MIASAELRFGGGSIERFDCSSPSMKKIGLWMLAAFVLFFSACRSTTDLAHRTSLGVEGVRHPRPVVGVAF